MKFLFWGSALLVVYTFVGYALLVWLQACLRPKPVTKSRIHPSVSIVMAVHNGANFIQTKLQNLFELAYPKEQMEIIVASDGSTDGTAEIIQSYERVRCIVCPRVGKAEALNRALAVTSNEIVVFTDVRQRIELGAIAELMSNFADEQVGCVSGELMFSSQMADGGVSGLSAYWQLEKLVRRSESQSGSVMGATGALYAVRRSLIQPLPPGTLLDDVCIPLQVAREHKRVIFDPDARVWDVVTEKPRSEFIRKVRTLAGNFQIVELLPWVLSDREIRFRFASHKLARLAAPWLLLVLLASSWALSANPVYLVLSLLQSAIYALAVTALLVPSIARFRVANAALAFCLMNAASMCAAFCYLRYRRDPARLWITQAGKATHVAHVVSQEP